jgi:hypothetical protein
VRATAADRAPSAHPLFLSLVCLAAWLIPGAGHLWQGRWQKGVVLVVTVPLMFAIGLLLDGRLFPFELAQPLVALAALASLANGLPYVAAVVMNLGEGVVTAATYEYGNTFVIVSGLLNMLIVIDAFDIALGRK